MRRYLDKDEKLQSLSLWQEAFPEDSKEFDDFYYSDKIKNNEILVKEEDGEIVSMIHLNPYRLVVRDQVWEIVYIVGVATMASKRHKGHMRTVLNKMIRDMYEKKMEFCFLMPADEKIYLPFDFTYIFDNPVRTLRSGLDLERHSYDKSRREDARVWLEQWLSKKYDVYCIRDNDYLDMFAKELFSENGAWNLLYDKGKMVGMECYWGKFKPELRALYAEDCYLDEKIVNKPSIMARIVNLKEFVKIITLKPDSLKDEITVDLYVTDDILEENSGRFMWHIKHDCSWLEACSDKKEKVVDEVLSISISRLTAWLFGYHRIVPEEWCKEVLTLQKVFLDEVV